MVMIEVYRRRDGRPQEGANVDVYWGLLSNFSKSARTDTQGRAYLDCDLHDGKVVINGDRVFEGRLQARMTFHI